MQTAEKQDSIDDIVDSFEFSQKDKGGKQMVPMTVWMPAEYKAKYDRIQEKSSRGFARVVREVFKATIDKVKLEV